MKTGLGVRQGHWKCHHSIDVPWRSINVPCNHGPISYRFWDRRWFPSKIAKFSHPIVFCTPAEAVHLELGSGTGGQKKLQWWGYQAGQKVS